MFEDVCLVCGRIADGLYCSDVCRDADAVQLPPSSIDHAIDLGFITDSIPPLVSSARPPRNPEDPSAVSSPTSSILTTPSVLDELDAENNTSDAPPATNGIHHQKGHDPSTITTGATTAMMTSAGTVLDSLLLPPTIQKVQPPPSSPVPPFHLPHPQSQTQQQGQQPQQVRSPRLLPTTGGAAAPALLPFARKPGNTNVHVPPPSTQPQHHTSHSQHHHHHNPSGSSSSSRVGGGSGSGAGHHHHHGHHRRTASFNPASGDPPSAGGGVNPGGGAGTPGPLLGGAAPSGYASPLSPASRGAATGLLSVHHQHQHQSSCSSHSHSRCSTSGHASPALSPLRADEDNHAIDRAKLLANLEELDLDGARGDPRRKYPQNQRVHVQPSPLAVAQGQDEHDALEKARKRRARASLPAYFSGLMSVAGGMHASSSKVPSTAVSSGTSSSDEQHKKKQQQRQQHAQQQQQKIRHVRSKSAMRASERSAAAAKHLSTSASTFKVGGGVGPARSNSDGSVAEDLKRAGAGTTTTSQAQSPTTPTVLTRNGSRNQLLAYFSTSNTTTTTMTRDGRDSLSPPPSRGRDRENVRGRLRGINTSVGGVALTPSVQAIVSPITATRHSMTPPGVLIHNDGVTAGGVSPASFAEKHIRFIASSVAHGGSGNLASRAKMLAALQGHLKSPPPPLASSGSINGKSIPSESPSSPIAIRAGSSSSGRPAGILEEEVPFVVPAGSNFTAALAPRLHQRLGAGGPGVGGKVTMSPKSRRFSSPTTSTAGIGAGLHVPIALMMSPAIIARPAAKPTTAIPIANNVVRDNHGEAPPPTVFGRGGRRNSRREEEMSPPRPVVRRGWSPVRGRGAAAVFDDDDEEEEEEEDKEENDDADEEEEEEEEEPQRGRSRSRMRSRSRARSRSLERERRPRRSFGVAGY